MNAAVVARIASARGREAEACLLLHVAAAIHPCAARRLPAPTPLAGLLLLRRHHLRPPDIGPAASAAVVESDASAAGPALRVSARKATAGHRKLDSQSTDEANMTVQPTTLLDHDNPLLEAIGHYVPYDHWPEILERDPLKGIDFGSLDEERKDFYIELVQKRFAATATSLEVAASLQTMMRTSYRLRNPTLPEQRRRLAAMVAGRGKRITELELGEPIVYGKLIMGVTGLGKSVMVERALSLVPRVCVHERCEAAGWIRHVQIPVVVVEMPASRGGLLYAILEAIDRAAGTNYRRDYANSRVWTVDKLFIEVALLLALHSVGLLIVEEIQVRNFALSPHREELLLFFLRLLNQGIPVVLIGNPLGFSQIDDFSQDARRLTRSDPVELMPAPSLELEDWDQGIARAIWAYGSTEGSPTYEDVRDDLWRHSGGFPDFAAMIGAGTLRLARRNGGRTAEHLKRFIDESPRLKMNRDLIDGFALKDPLKLSRYLDVPWEDYALRWGYDLSNVVAMGGRAGAESTSELSDDDTKALVGLHARLRAQHQRALTQARRRAEKDEAARAKAQPGDLRGVDDRSKCLAKGIDALRKELESAGA